MATRKDITADLVRQLLDFDEISGSLLWKARTPDMFKKPNKKTSPENQCARWNRMFAGKPAGETRDKVISIWSKILRTSDVACLWYTGEWPIYRDETKEERKKWLQKINKERWLAKPGNIEKAKRSTAEYRKTKAGKEAYRKTKIAYTARNREKERLRAGKWRENFPEKAKDLHRSYYVRNTDKVLEANKAFRLANKEIYDEYRRTYQARKRGASVGRLPRGYIKRLMSEQHCTCNACRCNLNDTGYHVDHIIPISKGGPHCESNLQLLCPTCNNRKGAKDFQDFINLLELERNRLLMAA